MKLLLLTLALLTLATGGAAGQSIRVTATIPEEARLDAEPALELGPGGAVVRVSVAPITRTPAFLSAVSVAPADRARLQELLPSRPKETRKPPRSGGARTEARVVSVDGPGQPQAITVTWTVVPQL